MPDAIPSPGAACQGRRFGPDRGAAFAAWAFVALLFGAYPIALVCPMGLQTQLVFHFAIPTLFLLALTTQACLLAGRLHDLRPQRPNAAQARLGPGPAMLWTLVAVYAAACILSAWRGRTATWHEVVILIGYVTIPVFYAICPRRWMPRRLAGILAVLWVLNLLHCVWQATVASHQMVGLAGNRNWLAALTVALTPWCWLAVASGRRGHAAAPGPQAATARRKWLRRALLGGSALCALVLLWNADCRATWLALGAYAFLFLLLPRLSRFLAVFVGALVPVVALAVFAYLPDKIIHAVESDIRLPMYASTVRLVGDNPLLGVGPGNYRRDFARYRSLAHKSRFVAAPVTEHPHNEILHVAACVGLPAALLWGLILLPLLAPPKTQSVFWRTVHFSAFTLVMHAMFDKALIQPPTALLGFFFLGLLWRPRLRVRWRPAWAGARLHRHAALVALAAAACGALWVGVREARTSWLFRRAFILETSGRFQDAYAAYARSATVNPNCVQTHAYSGIIANNKLRDPERALGHLVRARQIEPDFAHINGDIGLALGSLRKHGEALPFFQREAQLYPFDVIAHQRLFLCGLVTGRVPDMDALFERIAWLRYRSLIRQFGDQDTTERVAELTIAIAKDQPRKAMAMAEELLAPLSAGTAEPGFFPLAQQAGIPTETYTRPFRESDHAYWRRLLRWRRLLGNRSDYTLPELLAAFAAQRDEPATNRSHAADFAAFVAQADTGIEVGLLRKPDGADLGVIEVRQGANVWLASPATGLVRPDRAAASLRQDPALAMEFGLTPDDTAAIAVSLPVWPLEFWTRHQALGQVLRLVLGRPAPVLGASPELRRQRYQRALAAAPGQGTAPQQTTPSITVSFDIECFRAFAATLSPAPANAASMPTGPERRE